MLHGRMIFQILIFHHTHEEQQGSNFASPFFTFQLTTTIVQALKCHVTMQHIFVVLLTSV